MRGELLAIPQFGKRVEHCCTSFVFGEIDIADVAFTGGMVKAEADTP